MNTEILSSAPLSHVAQPDWFLQSFVDIVNASELEFGITLQVSGLLVSGNLVGGKKYFDGFAEDFSGAYANDPETAEIIKNSLAKHGEMYEEKEGVEILPPQFIHLKNAHFFNTSGSPIPGNKGVWWRGRVSEVGGFTLGILEI